MVLFKLYFTKYKTHNFIYRKLSRKRQADTSRRYSHGVGLSIVQFAQSPHIVLPMTTSMTKQETNSYINMIQPTGELLYIFCKKIQYVACFSELMSLT